jgi:hypothetical protein
MRSPRAVHVLVAAGLACVVAAAYLVIGAWLLRHDLTRVLLAGAAAGPGAFDGAPGRVANAFDLKGPHDARMPVRVSGKEDRGCAVYFPDEDGGDTAATLALFDGMRQAGLAVYAVTYPGQAGASPRTSINELMALATQAVAMTVARCGASRTVVVGRALGGMLGAQASTSLAAAVRAHLRDHAWLYPLAWLPVERLVERDVALVDVIPSELHVVIFQGDADDRATIAELWPDDTQPAQPPIVAVPGGTHADTLARATPAMIATVIDMIRGSLAEEAAGGEDN